MKLEELYLYDLKELDRYYESIKDKNNIAFDILNVMRLYLRNNDPDFMNSTNKKTSEIRSYYSVGTEGHIHGILLSLYLRSNNNELKNKVKELYIELGMEEFYKFLKGEINNNKIDNIIKVLINDYIKSIQNKYIIDEYYEIIKEINNYFKDQTKRLYDILDSGLIIL